MTANTTASVRAFADRRWLCLISAMVICVCAGFGYAWSVLQTPIIARFGWADSGVALAYTITVVCSTMAPLLFGGLIRRMSSRLCVAVGAVLFGAGLFAAGLMSQLWQLYLFYGVISGLGVGFIYPSMMAYVVRLFPDRSGMASGLGTAAYGSGAILWAPTAAALMEKVGLGSAFRVLGVLFAAVILLGSLLLAEPPEGFHAAMAPAASGGQGSGADLNRGQMARTGAFYRMVAVFTCGLVAVVRAKDADDAMRIAEACIEGGCAGIELTYTTPGVNAIIEKMAREYDGTDFVIGAGTVMDPETARMAILSGAQYVVSPYFNGDTVRLCNRYRVACMPGAMSIAEVVAGMEAGADIIKVFPGELFGPKILKSIHGPIPQAELMPTGGVSLDNVAEWIAAGAVAVGAGGSLTAGAKTGDYGKITETARQFVEKIRAARGQ